MHVVEVTPCVMHKSIKWDGHVYVIGRCATMFPLMVRLILVEESRF